MKIPKNVAEMYHHAAKYFIPQESILVQHSRLSVKVSKGQGEVENEAAKTTTSQVVLKNDH